MTTQSLIIEDIANHPDSSPPEIARRLFLEPQSIRKHLNGSLSQIVIQTQASRGAIPARYQVRSGLNWCPLCWHIMERVGK